MSTIKENDKIKLTQKEIDIIYMLQNGWALITDRDSGAFVCKGYSNIKIRLDIFWRMERKGLIRQGGVEERFNFNLTKYARNLQIGVPKNIPKAKMSK